MSSALDEVLEGFEPSPQLVSVMTGSRPAVVLSLDIGTSGIRAALFDERGEEIEGANIRLRWPAMYDDATAFNAELRLSWTGKAIDDLLALSSPVAPEIQLISISCFWHSLVGVAEDGDSTTPVFTWASTEATRAAAELRRSFNEPALHARTGCRFHPSYWPAKLRWLSQEERHRVAATRYWMSFGEFLVLHLCNETAASISMASGTGLFNQQRCDWDAELIDALHIPIEALPKLAGSHTTFQLNAQHAARWPQLSEAKLFPAIGDGAADAIASGCATRNNLALMVGSSGALRLLYRGEPPAQIPPELWCYRADDKRVILGGALSDGGNLYEWLRDSLPNIEEEWIENSLAQIEPDAHGLTILPFWAGERSPGWSLTARGAILGLTSKTQPLEILRAAMEAVAYRFALIHRALVPFAPDAAIVASGTALRRSPVWIKILADVLGTPITLSTHREGSALGAALLALEAAGKIANIETWNVVAGVTGETFEPDIAGHARYQVGLERQQRIYDQLVSET